MLLPVSGTRFFCELEVKDAIALQAQSGTSKRPVAPSGVETTPQSQPARLTTRENECHLAIGAVLASLKGASQSIVYLGPRGIGKSSLLNEIADRIANLLTNPIIAHARFGAASDIFPALTSWAAIISSAILGERLSAPAPPDALAILASQASRRNETDLRQLVEGAIKARENSLPVEMVHFVLEMARVAASRTRLPIVFLLDDIDNLIQFFPSAAEALEEAAMNEFTWIATCTPLTGKRFPLLPAFRHSPLPPLDPAESAQVVKGQCNRRGRYLSDETARAIGSCLQGHGALTDAYARELALASDPEPGLESHVRLLIDSLEQSAFATTLALEFQSFFPETEQRTILLDALSRLGEEKSIPQEGPLGRCLMEQASKLRTLGLLDWQGHSLSPTPLWAMRQLISMWRHQTAAAHADLSGGRLWRCSEALRQMHSIAPAGESELDASILSACLAALSGAELDSSHFVILPESLSSTGRIRLPLAIATEPLKAVSPFARARSSTPSWMVMAGMLGINAQEHAGGPEETSFWIVAAFSPPIAVNEEDVRMARQMAESIALDAGGMKPAAVWIIGGEFVPNAERTADMEGVMLSTWKAWRQLNGLPDPTDRQLESEAPVLFDPSGLGFALDLVNGGTGDAGPAIEASSALAQRCGFSFEQCGEITEAVRRACHYIMQPGISRARLRARFEDQMIVIAVERENPRWQQDHHDGPDANPEAWDLSPLKSRMDQVQREHLPWGTRLILRKRIDSFSQQP